MEKKQAKKGNEKPTEEKTVSPETQPIDQITEEDLKDLDSVFKHAQKALAEDERQYALLIMLKQRVFKKLQP